MMKKVTWISKMAIYNKIKKLKRPEYNIRSCIKEFKLVKDAALPNEYEIKLKLGKPFSVCKIIKYYKELPSSQATTKVLAQMGFDEGTVVIVEKQTDGYGRIKKTWSSNPGGLWFSILLKPPLTPQESTKLALILSIAIKQTLHSYNVISKIKWPNDILVNNKKIAGVITEMSAEQNTLNWIVVGIGININNKLPKELKNAAVSLKETINECVDRTEFIFKFLINFEKLYAVFIKKGLSPFLKEYNDNLLYMGKPVTINTGCNTVTGINLGIDENGMLTLQVKGTLKKIISGTLREAQDEN